MNQLTVSRASQAVVQVMAEYKAQLSPMHGWNHKVGSGDKLIPETVCSAIVTNVDAAMVPAGDKPETAKKVLSLLGAYPFSQKSVNEMENPEIWMMALTAIFAENPEGLHQKAVSQILKRCKFRPTIFEVNQIFEELKGEWALSQFIAKRHLKEHKRREEEAAKQAKLAAITQEDRERMAEKVKEAFGSFQTA